MIDTIGVALAGSVQPAAKTITEFVSGFGGKTTAGVIGGKTRTPSPLAALANGTIAHILDYDDWGAGSQGHPSAVLVPAVLALGEELMAPGKEVIAAYVLGLEIEAKISGVMPDLHLKGWHPTGVLGTLSAAAAAARLLKLSTGQTAIALGIASSEAAGLARNFGTMTKPLHAGNAAKNGIVAALMAKAGITASANIFDGDGNFLTTFYGSSIGDSSSMLTNLGNPYALISPGLIVKPYPSCGATHRPLDAILYLINSHDIKPEEIESIKVLSTPVFNQCLSYTEPRTALEGKFSMQFAMAAALTDRRFGLAQVTDKRVNDPAIKSLMKRITLSVHTDWVQGRDTTETRADVVTVKLKSGKEYRHEVLVGKGSAGNPLTEEELLAKYGECAKLVLDDATVERCIELVWKLEKLADVKAIMQIIAG